MRDLKSGVWVVFRNSKLGGGNTEFKDGDAKSPLQMQQGAAGRRAWRGKRVGRLGQPPHAPHDVRLGDPQTWGRISLTSVSPLGGEVWSQGKHVVTERILIFAV